MSSHRTNLSLTRQLTLPGTKEYFCYQLPSNSFFKVLKKVLDIIGG